MQKQVDNRQVIFTSRIWCCVCRVLLVLTSAVCLQKKLKKLKLLLINMVDSLMLKGNGKRVVMIIKLLTRYRM